MMIGKKKVSRRELKKTGGRVHIGTVKFKEIPCGGSAYILVNAIPSWGVYLFLDAGDDVEVGFDYDNCEELARQLTEPLDRSLIRAKRLDMVGDLISVNWCDRDEFEDGQSYLMVQRCQGKVMLTIRFDQRIDDFDFNVNMDSDAAKQLAGFIDEAISPDCRSPRMKQSSLDR